MPMTEFHYEPLSYLDASFLALETKTSHMHVAGVALLDAAPLKGEDGGIDIARIRAHVESKLRYIPRYRQRLDWVPFDRRPVWVDDEHFSID
jgi:diacylglycerol O-acyltransferase / wax synthase